MRAIRSILAFGLGLRVRYVVCQEYTDRRPGHDS